MEADRKANADLILRCAQRSEENVRNNCDDTGDSLRAKSKMLSRNWTDWSGTLSNKTNF
jgi:hypothetical protein